MTKGEVTEDMLIFLSVFAPNLHHVIIGGQHADKCRQDAIEELLILLNYKLPDQ
jgi:hypothetical protein